MIKKDILNKKEILSKFKLLMSQKVKRNLFNFY